MPYQPRTVTYLRDLGKIMRFDGIFHDDQRDLGIFRPTLEIYKSGGEYQATLLDMDDDQLLGRTLQNPAALGKTPGDAVRVLAEDLETLRQTVNRLFDGPNDLIFRVGFGDASEPLDDFLCGVLDCIEAHERRVSGYLRSRGWEAEAKARAEQEEDERHDPDPATETGGPCVRCWTIITQNAARDRLCGVCLSYDLSEDRQAKP